MCAKIENHDLSFPKCTLFFSFFPLLFLSFMLAIVRACVSRPHKR